MVWPGTGPPTMQFEVLGTVITTWLWLLPWPGRALEQGYNEATFLLPLGYLKRTSKQEAKALFLHGHFFLPAYISTLLQGFKSISG